MNIRMRNLPRLARRGHHTLQVRGRLVLVLALVFATPCLAQSPEAANAGTGSGELFTDPLTKQAMPSITGLSKAEVVERFGEPGNKEVSSDGRVETWHYGRSAVFVTEDKVSAWSDAGELSELAALKQFEPTKPSTVDEEEEHKGWVNAWTPEDRETSEAEVIDGLIPAQSQKGELGSKGEPGKNPPSVKLENQK